MVFPLHESGLTLGNGKNFSTFLIGILAGAFGGLVGLGGGVVMIPLLVFFLGMTQHKAHGTSLAALVFTGAAAATAYWFNGQVDIAASVYLAIPAIITAGAGARYAHILPEWRLKRYFGVFLFFVALMLLCKPLLSHQLFSSDAVLKAVALLLTGAIVGFISGMMGVGGGSVMVPAMVLLAGMGQHVAQGSSLLAMVPIGISGAKAHWKLGNIAANSFVGLLPGIVIGSFAGGKLAALASEGALRVLFCLVLIFTAARLVQAKP